MAAYRRFVSYIYRYEGEEKGKNVGFARVESRGDREKISLWIKDGCGEDALTLESAFLLRRNGQTVKIPVGEFVLEQGDGDYVYEGKGKLPAGDASFEEAFGMMFTGQEFPGRIFAMVWDEAPFEPGLVISLGEMQRERIPQMVWENELEVVPRNPVEKPREELAEEFSEEFQREIPDDDRFREELEADIREDEQEYFQDEFLEDLRENTRERFPGTRETSGRVEPPVENLVLDETPNSSMVWEERQEKIPVPVTGPEDDMEESWYFLSRRYTKVNPLAPEHGAECLKIRPGDIGRLPRAYWIFCNNSFLLKGYYQFQHLLLARFPGKDRPVYYLCVPGRYYGNDKFTAEMFGFDHFFPSDRGWRKDPQVTVSGKIAAGTFGYWCAEVETEHDTGRTLHERSFKTSEKSI